MSNPLPTKLEEGESLEQVVYIGVQLLKGNKLGASYITTKLLNQIDPKEFGLVNRISSSFEINNKSGSGIIGGIYEMTVTLNEGGRIIKARTIIKKFIAKLNDPRVIDWEVADASARATIKEQRLVARLAKDDRLQYEMKRLKEVYERTGYADRLAFELMIINTLRRR